MSGETPASGFRLITDTSGVRHMVDAGGVRQLTEEQPGIWDLAIAAGNWHGIVQFAKGVLGAPDPERGEIRTCYCGTTATVMPEVFPHPDCDGSVRSEPQPAPDLAADPFGVGAFTGHGPGCGCDECEGARSDAAIDEPTPGPIYGGEA
jgi:hypothetical protein